MPIPKAIEEQARKADELMGQGKTGSEATPPAQPAPPAPTPANVATTPQPASQPNVQPTAQPTAEPAPVAQPAMPEAQPANWEQKYRVLQGKYSAEVVRVQRDARAAGEENAQLKARLNDLESEIAQLKSAPAPRAPEITPEEREQYGEEFVNFVAKVAQANTPKAPSFDMSAVEDRLRPVEEVAVKAARATFFQDLTPLAPSWQALNTDPGFLAWLADADPLTGMQRQVLFDDAYGKLDVHRVAAFFTAYGGQSVGAVPNGLPTMEEQVGPASGGNTPPPPVPGQKRIWGRGEIAAFYEQVRRRQLTTEEAARTEAEIQAAQREGRVR
jgi:hypothetical protein